ncbi:MAG TPA: ABC transporter permease, partial [Firmicutes bacterium]|nr:ABC transporter permease [Bacillota bacterium]
MNRLKFLLKYVYAMLVVFVFWFILHVAMDSFVIPNPIAVIGRLFEIAIPKISYHLVASLYRLLIALSITTLIGYSLGLAIGLSK